MQDLRKCLCFQKSSNKVNNKNLLSVSYKQSIVLGPQEWKIKKREAAYFLFSKRPQIHKDLFHE